MSGNNGVRSSVVFTLKVFAVPSCNEINVMTRADQSDPFSKITG